MAVLNKAEKLICKAAKSNNAFLSEAFNNTLNYFKASSLIEKNYDDCTIIEYLYCHDHKGETFDFIANVRFHISLSTLEDRRMKYVKIFEFYLKETQYYSEAAITS